MGAVHVTVRVGTELYALPVQGVLEVAEIGKLTPVPGGPAGTLGLQNLRGASLPVFDLAALLGVAGDQRPERLVVAEDRGRRAGLAIDEVCGVDELPSLDEDVDHPLLVSAALTHAGLIGLVDLPRLLDQLEGEA